MQTQRDAVRFGPVQIGIVVAAVITALIHFYINIYVTGEGFLFILNGLGYLALTVVLFLPQSTANRFLPGNISRSYRSIVRYIFIGYTLLTILLWVIIGTRSTLAYVDKIVEVVLVVLLWLDRSRE